MEKEKIIYKVVTVNTNKLLAELEHALEGEKFGTFLIYSFEDCIYVSCECWKRGYLIVQRILRPYFHERTLLEGVPTGSVLLKRYGWTVKKEVQKHIKRKEVEEDLEGQFLGILRKLIKK